MSRHGILARYTHEHFFTVEPCNSAELLVTTEINLNLNQNLKVAKKTHVKPFKALRLAIV